MTISRSKSVLTAVASGLLLAFAPGDEAPVPATRAGAPKPSMTAGGMVSSGLRAVGLKATRTGKRSNPFGRIISVSDDDGCDGRIGDRVWHDRNRNGLQDEGEHGLPGVEIGLYAEDFTRLGSATTDERGLYMFGGLCHGTYYVIINENTLPGGFVRTPCNEGNDDARDNDCSPAPGFLVRDDARDMTVDFGFQCDRGEQNLEGDEGCTPGYWKQPHHFDSWPADIRPTDKVSDHFRDDVYGDILLRDALAMKGGGCKALLRHGVAALLNACSPNVDYGLTVPQVIGVYETALAGSRPDMENAKNGFRLLNEMRCPLN